ncbi:hypothetical protein B0O99DRAFT_239359 [Bisporella sp. PMI_857]|nr:hypothetical protein B0O99DRAFT_239359 [Bisporella sp. PMI_857]
MEPRRVETVLGPVYSKPRKLIVLSIFEGHCLTVPIFSFNENGLKYKSNKGDFVKIEDSLIQDHPPPSENGYAPLTFSRAKEYRHFNNGFHVMSPSSYAHITFPVSFRYVHPCIIEGKITQDSLRDLIDLYNARAPVLSTARKRGNFAAKKPGNTKSALAHRGQSLGRDASLNWRAWAASK